MVVIENAAAKSIVVVIVCFWEEKRDLVSVSRALNRFVAAAVQPHASHLPHAAVAVV